MLIYTTSTNSTLSIEEQVRQAFDNGCGWIQLNLPAEFDAEQKHDCVDKVLSFCKGADMILTIGNDSDLVLQTRVHGVHLDAKSTLRAPEIRQQLGPHAIIGITSSSADEINEYRLKADVDYVELPLSCPIEEAARLSGELNEKGITLPLVFSVGDDIIVDADKVKSVFINGAKGLSYSSTDTCLGDRIQNILNIIDSIM